MSYFEDLTKTGPLLVLDLANNHNGSVEHGKKIVVAIKDALRECSLPVAIKFQYRDLDTFIHPAFKGRQDIKYVKRFESTRLSWDEFRELRDFVSENGFLAACTPFDEASVAKVVEHEYDILKIASASFTDWPLLERISKETLPVIASTAAASVEEMDRVASFLSHRQLDFALMHCVAAYPTNDADLQLNRIDLLRNRYSDVVVGYSTHENPFNMAAVQMALAKGARILERHVGIGTSDSPLNDYSSDPQSLAEWVKSIEIAREMLGNTDGVFEPVPSEIEALQGLRRGVFVSREVRPGDTISDDAVFFAIPLQPGQLVANEWGKYQECVATNQVGRDEPLTISNTIVTDAQSAVWKIVEKARELFNSAGIIFPSQSHLEISHHYGIDRFDNYGLLMLTVVNRDYCKKLLGLLPNQNHPEQFHKLKEETFHCLWGEVELWLDDKLQLLKPGDVITVQPGVRHKFSSASGAVIEEISSTHIKDDSYYTDDSISKNPNRKTFVMFWN